MYNLRCGGASSRGRHWGRSTGTWWAVRSVRSVWWAEQRQEDRDEGKRQNVCGRAKNTKQKVRRDNWVGGHETEKYSNRMFVCLCVWWEILHKRRCQQVHPSTNTKLCIGIYVYVCAFICVPKNNTASSLPFFLQSITNEEPHHHGGIQGQA